MLKVFSNLEELSRFAAEKFIEIAGEAIEKHGGFTVALAGGSTPKSLYQLLGSGEFKNKIDWSKVFFFFGDERNVAPGDAESNFRMANENLFQPLRISVENIFRWQTEIENAEEIAETYAEALTEFFGRRENSPAHEGGSDLPHFDLILLGMGDDGHTASLFPFTKALTEKSRIAVENWVEKLNSNRLTLTFPAINNASNIIFLISGASKAVILREVLEDEFRGEQLPSQNVKPTNGNLFWLIDTDSARLLNNSLDEIQAD